MSTTLPLCQSPIVGGPASTMVTTLLQALITAHCALTTPSVWPEDYGPIAANEGLDDYDFVVVGGGTSGAVVASRLSENPNFKVLVIEAGEDPVTESEIPALIVVNHRGYETYGYEIEPNPAACQGTTTGTCYWPISKVMGGSSSIDYIASFRGSKGTFDEWNLPNWSWVEVLRYYEIAENYQSPTSNPNGRLVINELDEYNNCDVGKMIFNGGEELGLRRILPYVNGNARPGYGYVKGHIENGQRMGAGKTYLSVVKSRPNIHVIKKAEARKINFDAEGTVESVTFVYDETVEITVNVLKEVILAAGALGNPKLLMLSGIGPPEQLIAHGIPIVRDLPGVGQNLQDQIAVPVPFQHQKSFAKPKTAKESQIDTFYYLLEKYGPLSTIGYPALFGLISGDASCAYKNCPFPDLVIHHYFSQRNDITLKIWYDSVGLASQITQSLDEFNKDGNMLLSFVSLQNPKSRGFIELQSADYRDKVNVFANYFEDDRDIESILQGIRFQMELEQTEAYKKGKAEIVQLDIPVCNQLDFKSDDYWRCYIKYMVTTMYHPGGTTKMGIDTDPDAVVDVTLKVRGVTGMRVTGRSVFPTTITTSDPQVMCAERLAAFLKQDWA